MKRIKQIIAGMFMVSMILLPASSASAINVFNECRNNPNAEVCRAQGTDNATSLLEVVINVMIFLLGAIAVIMIIIGGIRYTTSGGDSSSITSAKNTILYAVIGLVVAIMAFAIVNFVLDQF